MICSTLFACEYFLSPIVLVLVLRSRALVDRENTKVDV